MSLETVPEENVKLAFPVVSVVTDEVLRMPVSALSATTAPGTAALDALSAVTVTVVDVELSDLTVVGIAERESVAAATTAEAAGVVGGAAVPGAPAPQPARKAAVTAIKVKLLAWVKRVVCKAAP